MNKVPDLTHHICFTYIPIDFLYWIQYWFFDIFLNFLANPCDKSIRVKEINSSCKNLQYISQLMRLSEYKV